MDACKSIAVKSVLLICQFIIVISQEQCLNTTTMTVRKVGLSESQLWKSKAQDLEQCAKLCIRLKPCRSITYDTRSGLCELNSGTRQDTSTRSGETLVYSEFSWWPSSVRISFFCILLLIIRYILTQGFTSYILIFIHLKFTYTFDYTCNIFVHISVNL